MKGTGLPLSHNLSYSERSNFSMQQCIKERYIIEFTSRHLKGGRRWFKVSFLIKDVSSLLTPIIVIKIIDIEQELEFDENTELT